MENITTAMAELTVDMNNEESQTTARGELTSNQVVSQCTTPSQHLAPGSAHDCNLTPSENIAQDMQQSHVETPFTAQDIVEETELMRANMHAQFLQWQAEMEMIMNQFDSRQAKERVFIVFPSLPKEIQLKIWKAATIPDESTFDIVTEVFYCPGKRGEPNPRFVSNKKLSPLLYTCQDSRKVAFKEHYSLAMQYDIGFRAPYVPVYSHPTDVIYLQIHVEDRSILNHEIRNAPATILNAVNQGITTLALNFDYWSCAALFHETKIIKKLEHLFLVVSIPDEIDRGRRLCMYAVDPALPRFVKVADSQIVPMLKEVFAKLKREDPSWEPPIMELVGMKRLRK